MNIFIKIVAIIYRSYEDRGVDIPHFRAIVTTVLILFLHMVHIGLAFDISSKWIMPWNSDSSRSSQWLFGLIYFGTFIVIIAFVFQKRKLEKINVSQRQIDRGRLILPIYLTLSIVILLVLLIAAGNREGRF